MGLRGTILRVMKMKQIKAIQTSYAGYKFRSRLEARWAVFFDALGIKWEYEPEGFDLGGGVYYLPDFKVTSNDGFIRWYEIKGVGATCEKFSKFQDILFSTGSLISDPRADMLIGDPYSNLVEPKNRNHGLCPRCGMIGLFDAGVTSEHNGIWYGCFPCDAATPSGGYHDAEEGLMCAVSPHKGYLIVDHDEHLIYRRKLINAAKKARSARFEYGETPS